MLEKSQINDHLETAMVWADGASTKGLADDASACALVSIAESLIAITALLQRVTREGQALDCNVEAVVSGV